MPLIKCENLSFAYSGETVLSGVGFEVNAGDYLCIVGENGSGKSTLVRGILGLKEPSGGSISYGGGLRPDGIGYLPQQTEAQRDFPASVFELGEQLVEAQLGEVGLPGGGGFFGGSGLLAGGLGGRGGLFSFGFAAGGEGEDHPERKHKSKNLLHYLSSFHSFYFAGLTPALEIISPRRWFVNCRGENLCGILRLFPYLNRRYPKYYV